MLILPVRDKFQKTKNHQFENRAIIAPRVHIKLWRNATKFQHPHHDTTGETDSQLDIPFDQLDFSRIEMAFSRVFNNSIVKVYRKSPGPGQPCRKVFPKYCQHYFLLYSTEYSLPDWYKNVKKL